MESSVVVKTFRLLEAIASDPGCSLAELSSRLCISKPSTHRVLGDLVSLGYVQRDAAGRYYSGSDLWKCMPGADARLLAAAEPAMRRLWRRTHETINLGVLAGRNVRYLQVFNSDLPLRRDVTPGAEDPALTTALGRILIAGFSPKDQARFLRELPTRRTQFTLTRESDLQAAIAAARTSGYAVDREETDLGVMCVAVALPRTGGIPAALSLSLPVARLEQQKGIEAIARLLTRAAAAITSQMKRQAPLMHSLPGKLNEDRIPPA